MYEEMTFNQRASPDLQARQRPLFPLDPWGREHAFAVMDKPCPGISSAMIGPLTTGGAEEQSHGQIYCLAACNDGKFAAWVKVSSKNLQFPDALWGAVARDLWQVRLQHLESTSSGWQFSADDCLKQWADAGMWGLTRVPGQPLHGSLRALARLLAIQESGSASRMSADDGQLIESGALSLLTGQLMAGVHQVMAALQPDLRALLTQRRKLSMGIASRVMDLATRQGPQATAYALQALRTESLGVLHLLASGKPEREAQQVRDAVFTGCSLPDILADLGVAKAAHRHTVSKVVHPNASAPEELFGLADLSLSGRHWLNAMRLTKILPFQSRQDSQEFSRLIEQLQSVGLGDTEVSSRLLSWCIALGHVNSGQRLSLFLARAGFLSAVVGRLTGMVLTQDTAIELLLRWIEGLPGETAAHHRYGNVVNSDDLTLLLEQVSALSGQSSSDLVRTIFDAHPGLPDQLPTTSDVMFEPLNTMDLILLHGKACGNCLDSLDRVLRYVKAGVALYGVSSKGDIAGTVALRYDQEDRAPRVQVQEVSGVRNQMARYDLCHWAQRLADSWTTPQQKVPWSAYEVECSNWRLKIAMAHHKGSCGEAIHRQPGVHFAGKPSL